MKLVGMLDSPFVRRVAISMQCLQLPFEHQALSVFRDIDEFKKLSPVVKAPSLLCDDGTVLLDSNLILDYLETLASQNNAENRLLLPTDVAQRSQALHCIGLAMIACEKSVQIYYEWKLRPVESQFQAWLERISEQLETAYRELELSLSQWPAATKPSELDQVLISAAVAWRFTCEYLPELVPQWQLPILSELSQWAESRPEFQRAGFGEDPYPVMPTGAI
ncbi:glutathione S-transferase [Corallincola spongiicola]|uniref:Glutathione S-transferase n=1 Tax=Corallincola spongiicola TaxID=2520508 RepID=A0ABY1WVD2_9GAMM|nr:glutathione S-transferase [Corallincola spongiicola]TAA48632.1 glutathione S-transferase [Corallincola spongiicola]